MRRATALIAALGAASSIALIAPSAQAAPAAGQTVGTASCTGGATLRIETSIDASHTAKAVATVTGAKQSRWVGEVVAGIDESTQMSSGDAAQATQQYTAKNGRFTAVATRADASTADAVAAFASTGLRSSCGAMVMQRGTQYGVISIDGATGVIVAAGPRSAIDASIAATRNHRYRATFTVTGKGAPQRIVLTKLATKRGTLDIVARNVKRLGAFSKVSLQVVDLSDRTSQPLTYSVSR